MLDHPINGGKAQLFHRDGRHLGSARIRQGGGFLEAQTRQMRVFLEVSSPAKGVLAGDFLQVRFQGRQISDSVTLPETTLTRAGHIWLVDDSDRLLRHTPEILFRDNGTITIAPPALPEASLSGPWRIARTPLASFLPGQRVTPKLVEG